MTTAADLRERNAYERCYDCGRIVQPDEGCIACDAECEVFWAASRRERAEAPLTHGDGWALRSAPEET